MAEPTSRLLRPRPVAVARLTMLLGIVNLASALTPEQMSRVRALKSVVPLGVAHAASAGTAVAGVLLVFAGHGLRRRKRRAWRLAVALLAVSAVLHIVKGLDVEEAVLVALGLSILVAHRREFSATGDPRTRWRAPLVGCVMLAAAIGSGLLLLATHDVVGSPSVGDQLREVLLGLVGVSGPVRFGSAAAADVVSDILLSLGAATAVVTAYLALRPAEPAVTLSTEDEERLRRLLSQHGGRDSLGYFSLRRDKGVVFSPTGKAAVSYRVVSGVMLAAGDPVGDPEAWPGAITAFTDVARAHAWTPAVIGCGERGGDVWVREAGLRALQLGDEAIVEIDDFSLDGRAMRNVRQMVTRVERAGYVTNVRRLRDLTPKEVDELRRQASAWRGAVVERGFSMALGRFGDADDGDCVVVTAHLDGRLAALLHFVPWGSNGLSLDLMRRDRDAHPGLNELLIVAAIRAAPELGITQLSLNFAVFRDALERGAKLGAGPVIKAWRGLLLLGSRWFQIDSLYRFNAKFRPIWEPRFICYPKAADIPRVALAALEAEAFLVWPAQWLRHRRESEVLRPAGTLALSGPDGFPSGDDARSRDAEYVDQR